jgi:hypothetical protein
VSDAPEAPSETSEAENSAAAKWLAVAWYPLVVPVVLVVAVWSVTGIHPAWLIRPLLLVVVSTLVLTMALSLLLGNWDRGALACFWMVLAFAVNDPRVMAALLLIFMLTVAVGLRSRQRLWPRGPFVTRGLNLAVGILALAVVAGAIQSGSFANAVEDVRDDMGRPPFAATFDPAAPDIYVVLLDGYPGDDAAELEPTFDADSFPEALGARGFEVQRHSRSNYLLTRLTVATMFAGEHVAGAGLLAPPHSGTASDSRRLRRFGDSGPVFSLLAGAGYETVTIAADAAHLGLHRVDRVVEAPGLNEFEGALLRTYGAGKIAEALLRPQMVEMRRSNALAAIATAMNLPPSRDRPRFEWIHVMAPHPPLAFDESGHPFDDIPAFTWEEDPSRDDRADRLVRTFQYVTYVNQQALLLVDHLASLDDRSVIVLLSDHGPDTGFDEHRPLDSDLNERTSILLAVRAPGRENIFPAGTTPINVLPRLMNAYLGSTLPIRSDTSWAWPNGGSVLEAIPIDPNNLNAARP